MQRIITYFDTYNEANWDGEKCPKRTHFRIEPVYIKQTDIKTIRASVGFYRNTWVDIIVENTAEMQPFINID